MHKKITIILFFTILISAAAADLEKPQIEVDSQSVEVPGTVVVSGAVEGQNLNSMKVQIKDGGWDTVGSVRGCWGSSCEIERDYTSRNKGEKTFRIKAATDSGETRKSDEIDVEFYEEDDDKDPELQRPSISLSATRVEAPGTVTINGDVEGKKIDYIEVQSREDSSWSTVGISKNCSYRNTCDIERDFTSRSPADIDFKVRAAAKDGETKNSRIRSAEFYEKKDESPFFKINSLSSNSPVKQGEEIEVDALIENTGDKSGRQTVKLEGPEDFTDSTRLSLDSGESRRETLRWDDTSGRLGSYTLKISTEDKSRTIDVRVKRERSPSDPNFNIRELSTDSPVTEGETMNVDSRIKNIGGKEGTQEVILRKNGQRVDSKDLTLDKDESKLVNLKWRTRKSDAGENTVTVHTLNDKKSKKVNVNSAETDKPSNFKMQDMRTNSPIYQGRTAEAEVDIKNIGDRSGERELWLTAVDSVQDSKTISLEGGEQRTFNLEWSDTSGRVGTYNLKASTTDDSISRRITIRKDRNQDDDRDDDDDRDSEDGKGELKATVEDRSGNRLRDARVRAENSDTKTRYTDSNGRVYMDLRSGEYDVRVSKTGYRPQTRTLTINEDRTTSRTFTLNRDDTDRDNRLSIRNIQHSSSVCKGDFLSVDVTLYNGESHSETVKVTAQGIGDQPSKYVVMEPKEERTKTLTVTNLDQIGEHTFNIEAENGHVVSEPRSLKVEDCTRQVSTEATGLSLNINPREVNAGQTVTASGYLDGLRGQRGEITIKADGRTVARTNNDRDGYYQTYFRVHNPGEKTITAESQGLSQSRTLTVNPTVHVESISMPDKVLKGEEFEVCAHIQTQTTARVVLENRDGEVLEARDGSGETCFTTTARETGEQEYRVRAFTSGNGSSATRTVDVIESGPETEKFPDVVATEESGSGEFKVELYNTEDTIKVYEIEVSGIDRNWLSQSSREVHLAQGERKTVYFYMTPQVRGTYHPQVEITEDGETVFDDDVMVQTRGNQHQTRKTFLNRVKTFLRF